MHRLLFLLVMVSVCFIDCGGKGKPEDEKVQEKTQEFVPGKVQEKVEDEITTYPQGEQAAISNNYVKWTIIAVWMNMGIRAPSEADITIIRKLYTDTLCAVLVEMKGVEYTFIFGWDNGEWKYAKYELM